MSFVAGETQNLSFLLSCGGFFFLSFVSTVSLLLCTLLISVAATGNYTFL